MVADFCNCQPDRSPFAECAGSLAEFTVTADAGCQRLSRLVEWSTLLALEAALGGNPDGSFSESVY